MEDIRSFYESIRKEESLDYKKILSYEGVKDRIVFKLINTEKNREFLKTVPHTDILDLSVVFYALLEVSREGAAMMTICENHLRQWDIGRDVALEGCGGKREADPAGGIIYNAPCAERDRRKRRGGK